MSEMPTLLLDQAHRLVNSPVMFPDGLAMLLDADAAARLAAMLFRGYAGNDVADAEAAVVAAFEERQCAEMAWEHTDWDKLEDAFKQLCSRRRVLALHESECHAYCQRREMLAELKDRNSDGQQQYDGVIFHGSHETQVAAYHGELVIALVTADTNAASSEISARVVHALASVGLRVAPCDGEDHWGCAWMHCIHVVGMQWRRRRMSRLPAWRPSSVTHAQWPRAFRDNVIALLSLARNKEQLLWLLPIELLCMLVEYVGAGFCEAASERLSAMIQDVDPPRDVCFIL